MAIKKARFKKFSMNIDGEQNLVQYQKFKKWLKRIANQVQQGYKKDDFFHFMLIMNNLPSQLSETNNGRKRRGLPMKKTR